MSSWFRYVPLILAFVTASLTAAPIFTSTHTLTDPVHNWQVQIDLAIFGNYQGDPSYSEWRYTLTNISYDPPDYSDCCDHVTRVDGPSGFHFRFGDVRTGSASLYVIPVSDDGLSWNRFESTFTSDWGMPVSPWAGVGWLEVPCYGPNCPPNGIPVGTSRQFSILTSNEYAAAVFETQAKVFAVAWGNGKIFPYEQLEGTVYAPTLSGSLPIPEPTTAALIAAGLGGFALLRSRRYR